MGDAQAVFEEHPPAQAEVVFGGRKGTAARITVITSVALAWPIKVAELARIQSETAVETRHRRRLHFVQQAFRRLMDRIHESAYARTCRC